MADSIPRQDEDPRAIVRVASTENDERPEGQKDDERRQAPGAGARPAGASSSSSP